MNLKHTSITAVTVVALVLAGCGGGSKGHSRHHPQRGAAAQVLHLTADPSGSYDFIPFELVARPGRVTVELLNPSSTFGPHGIGIDGNGVHAVSRPAPRGGVTQVTATLKPGRYELYSPVDGDAHMGMNGTLAVVR